MKPATCLSAGALLLAGSAVADWQFKSRPDLAVPRLNITIPASGQVGKGFLFVAPFAGLYDTPTEKHGPRQAAPYIFRDDGELVWSGYSIYSIWNANFQAGRWKGRNVLFSFEGDHNALYGHGHGHITFLDGQYETIRELRGGNHKLIDKHEAHIVDEKTALIQVYQPVPRNLTDWGASPEQQWIVNAIIQELDIETGDLLFEWASLDHVSPDEAVLPLNPGQAGSGFNSSDAWDYFHINSVDKDTQGNYLVSARDACSIHKINGTDGSIIWRLHGKASSFRVPKEARFCFQHHARFVSQHDDVEVISLFDNSAHGTERGQGREVHTAPTSSGKIIRVNTTSWEAELVQAFFPPDDLLAKSQGSTQLLPNGNALVNWGSEGAVTEFTGDGTPVFHAYMDSGYLGVGVENYRAFRYEWKGLPWEEPAIAYLEGEDGSAAVYVSWNGDTETKLWRFYAHEGSDGDNQISEGAGAKTLLGEVYRTGFETKLSLPAGVVGAAASISAEALGLYRLPLRVTRAVRAEPEIQKQPETLRSPVRHQTAPSWDENDLVGVMRVQQ